MKRLLLVAFILCSTICFAANVNVNCNAPGLGGRIQTALKSLNSAGPNTIRVSGTCKENVTINGFDRLTLIAVDGATITDNSDNSAWAVFLINDSRRVSIQNFTIIGGNVGIECNDASLCRTFNNHIQNSATNGIDVNNSQLTSFNDSITITQGLGLSTNQSQVNADNLTVQGGNTGVNLTASVVTGVNWNVSGSNGDGIFANSNTHLQLIGSQLHNNAFNGIDAVSLTDVSLENDTVSGNGFTAVWLSDLTTAWFSGGSYFNGGSAPDIGCYGHMPIANNLSGTSFSTTNCQTPYSSSAPAKTF
jgi:hypothetical protein